MPARDVRRAGPDAGHTTRPGATRAVAWAIGQLRREHATIAGLARRLAVAWWALWRLVRPELERLAADETMHWTALSSALGRMLPAKALSFGA